VDFAAKLLMVVHGLCAVALLGSVTHTGLLAAYHLAGRPIRPKLRQSHAKITLWTYVATFTLGLILYPRFRLDVRAAYLDEHVPLATGFFELKEHLVAVGLMLAIAHFVMAPGVDVRARSSEAKLFHALGIALMGIVWIAALTGLVVVAIRPLGG
jgi:hypothetical protein